MAETFKDYVGAEKKATSQEKKSYAWVAQETNSKGFDHFYRLLIPRLPSDLRNKYSALRLSLVQLYRGYRLIEAKIPDSLDKLLHHMYNLDSCCGTDVDLRPDDSEKEQMKKLAILDADQEKFHQFFETGYLELSGNYRDLLIRFARLLYTFNGYQAPARNDPQKALEDALGRTDLFGEYLQLVQTKYEAKRN